MGQPNINMGFPFKVGNGKKSGIASQKIAYRGTEPLTVCVCIDVNSNLVVLVNDGSNPGLEINPGECAIVGGTHIIIRLKDKFVDVEATGRFWIVD